MVFLKSILYTSFICILTQSFCFSQSFTFSKANAANISISTPINPNEDELNAARLFKKYLDTIFNSNFTINAKQHKENLISVQTDTTLFTDEYSINIDAESIIILGGNHKGCTYAVIRLLENYFDCSYWSPGFKVIPSKNNVEITPIYIHHAPRNDVRIINLYYNEDQEFRDWNRLNTIEEVYPEGYFVHTFHRLIPWETYFEKHPEYFALQNGKRVIDQLCTSNGEVRDLIEQKLRVEMSAQPTKTKWSVSQNDNFTYCQCDKCSQQIKQYDSPSGPIIDLVNDIANRFPDKIISTLAYQYSRKAPKNIKPVSNVEVMLCTIEMYRHAPIETNPESADFKKDIEDWGKICSNIYLWDYTINFNHSISPFPNLRVLQPNIQFFTKNNVNALFEQSNSSIGYEFAELKVYLLSKLMWNPHINFDTELDKFLKGYYGSAAKYLKEYILELEKQMELNKSKLWIYEHPVVHQDGLLSRENIEKYKSYFDQAEAIVAKDSAILNHVKLARLPIQYAEMEIATNNMFSERGWYQMQNKTSVPNLQLFETLNDFEKTCIENNVPTVNESKLTPEVYISSLRKMIDVNIEGNLAFEKKVTTSVTADEKYQKGDLSFLTNGVSGASDYNIHWLGWFGKSTELVLDLEKAVSAAKIEIHSLWNGKSWILHPSKVTCSISQDGKSFTNIGSIEISGTQENEETIRSFVFHPKSTNFRYVKFDLQKVDKLPNWHASAGEPAWFFIDEIIVK